MANFNKFLRANICYLSNAGIQIGDDGWEDFVEQNFITLVVNRVGEDFDYWINTTYGVRPDGGNSILVCLPIGAKVQRGVEDGDVTTFNKITLTHTKELDFMGFYHPLKDPMKPDIHLNFVLCVRGRERFIADFSDCEFKVKVT